MDRIFLTISGIRFTGTDLTLAGLGLIQAPAFGTEALVASGALVEVLPDFVAPSMPVSLMLPHRRQLAPRVQAVMSWLTRLIAPLVSPTA